MTSEPETYVLDASVGVKWFKREAGSETARILYERSAAGEVRLAVPVHFVHEVLAIVQRELGASAIVEGWGHLQASGIRVLPLTDEVVAEAANQCGVLGCSFYDSLAPACAALLGATLASADSRAHAAFPGAFIVS